MEPDSTGTVHIRNGSVVLPNRTERGEEEPQEALHHGQPDGRTAVGGHTIWMADEGGKMNFIPIMLAVALAGAGTIETEKEMSYTDEDLYVLSHIISAEAGNCGEEMLTAVGSVVLNRVSDDRFPDTIEEVVFQTDPSLQYRPIEDGSYYNEPTEDALEVAEFLLENGSQLPADVIYQSNYIIGEYYTHLDPPPGVGKRMYFCR